MVDSESKFLPNLFILGAAKCGTTTLFSYLNELPDICMSDPKEPFFFEAEFENGLQFYQDKYFSHWNSEPILGDARVSNLYIPWVPNRIYETNPNSKLIVIVRNPIERAFSNWVHFRNAQLDELNFSEAIRADWERIQSGRNYETNEEVEQHTQQLVVNAQGHSGEGLYRTYIDRGYYFEQIQRYLKLFPREQLKIYLFEEFVAEPNRVVTEIIEFLELDPTRNRFCEERWENAANVPGWMRKLYEQFRFYRFAPEISRRFARKILRSHRRSKIDQETWFWLRDHYEDRNRELAEFLGRDLSHWNQV